MTRPQKRKDYTPVTVPWAATPTGEPPTIQRWAHPAVWTDRMLETLLQDKVRGGKWHTLFDKVFGEKNLLASADKVLDKQGAAGVDRQTVKEFHEHKREELQQLQQQLRDGTFRPQPVRRTWIPKPGSSDKRPLGIPTVRDRVVQTALVHVIEPIFDHTFHERSYGFRHGRGCRDALRQVEELLASGHVYVVDADLKSYFDTIPKDRLLQIVQEKISDSRVLELIQEYLNQGVMEELQTWTPEAGVPQGAVLSPVLANAYLNPLDHHMADLGFQMVRYADDFVILCRTPEEASQALNHVRQWVEQAGLVLHPEKTHIVDSRAKSFAFLGYSFRGRYRFPRAKGHQKFITRIRELTPRKSGESLERIIQRLNCTLRGWFNYFRHCFWNIFRDYDSMVRRRLRRILLKRHRLNPQRLSRTQRWPNAYFTQHGLVSLNEAQQRFVQSISTC
ncbi:MAG: group II intron reverse transcriptase/maturase [Pirellulaceae bacterium]|nr:group II intron reverse transcriptase/maturase [Pirellulaceae bacterium]